MAIRLERGATFAQKGTLLLATCGLMLAGCGRANDRLKQAYQDAGLAKVPVAPVSGIVTVDGLAPVPFTLVMLWDPKKPNANVLRTICDSEGRFAFTSYEAGDGVPPGTYVVLFAQFNMGRPLGTFDPPDARRISTMTPTRTVRNPSFKSRSTCPVERTISSISPSRASRRAFPVPIRSPK